MLSEDNIHRRVVDVRLVIGPSVFIQAGNPGNGVREDNGHDTLIGVIFGMPTEIK